ncbi:MAG: glycosyl hydrolase family 18 protein [Bacteroidetes bacterium]|nr:glycosyl hydrolase family 18 protein [Bacteroidota bacterium]
MRIKILITLILFSFSVSAQTSPSVMQMESRYYSTYPILDFQNSEQNLTLQKKKIPHSKLSKTVFGFLPWWEYQAGTYKNIRFDLLTHIAVFSFAADSLGTIANPVSWPWMDIINKANEDGIKLIVTITNFDTKSIHRILTDLGVQRTLFENIRKILMPYGISGVNIDFENIADADLQFAVINFLTALRDYLVKINPTVSYEISFATPAVGFGKWNYSALMEKCDYLFIMGYDFYGSWSTTTGPSSPLTGTNFNLTKLLLEDYSSVDPGKLVLGVPYYGNYWKTNSQNPYDTVAVFDTTKKNNNWQKFIYYRNLFPTYDQKEKLVDGISQTPWLRWKDTTWNQIWYDDSLSLAAKFDLALQKNLKGIGIWALGYDDGRNELWNLIFNKFGNPSSVQQTAQTSPVDFVLYQNYPNPFNPSTVISYQLSAASYVQLKIYDALGREVTTLVNEYQQAGIHNSQFLASRDANRSGSINNSQLGSGVYFYTLTAGNHVQTRKMVLMK